MSAGAGISGATQVLGVVGDPVAHSLSPLIHNRWIADAGLDAVYAAFHLKSHSAADDLRALARAGLKGLNITLPHKIAALQAADDASDLARRIGAANTLAADGSGSGSGSGWIAHNTDAAGFAAQWRAGTGAGQAGGSRVVLIGAGGAARAALCWLKDEGAAVAIVNRTPENADRLAQELGIEDVDVGALDQLARLATDADVVVNSASFGHAGAPPPDLGDGKARVFLEMSYGKAAAPMIARAQASGWRVEDGLSMLVGQAAEAFRIWFGIEPDVEAALRLCRDRVG